MLGYTEPHLAEAPDAGTDFLKKLLYNKRILSF